jgi:uncharacterized membrane protein
MVFVAASLVYLVGGQMLTISVNMPMNEELTKLAVRETAEVNWRDYSPRGQLFNQVRMVISGVSLALAGWGMFLIGRGERRPARGDVRVYE